MAKHIVKCPFCGQNFDVGKEEFVKVYGGRRYAHPECAKQKEEQEQELIKQKEEKALTKKQKDEQKTQEQKDKEALEEYVKKLFNETYVNPRARKQINTYVNDYNYTYSGILKALIYFYEIKHGNIEKAHGSLGIVPYIYKDSYNYYYSLWLAQQANKDKDIKAFAPTEAKVIVIPVPKKCPRKRPVFTFLDETEII